MPRCQTHPNREATGECGRCRAPFCGLDRRVQPRGRDLCRRCHLDPRARAMPVEVEGGRGWWGRSARTLFQLLAAPNASFRQVREPVDHAVVVRFMATARLPLWCVLLVVLCGRWLTDTGYDPIRPNALSSVVDLYLADAFSLWLLLMVPLGVPLIYFFGGIATHGGAALTGGAQQSLGASMRAFGYTAAWPMFAVALLDFPLYLGMMSPAVYVYALSAVIALQYLGLSLAVAQTHGMRWPRGFIVAGAPALFFASVLSIRGALELPHVPFTSPPSTPYIPYIP